MEKTKVEITSENNCQICNWDFRTTEIGFFITTDESIVCTDCLNKGEKEWV